MTRHHEMSRRQSEKLGPSFTFRRIADQPSAWSQTALYGGSTALLALVLALAFSTVRPTPRRRTPTVPAPARARDRQRQRRR
jgi:hypothetical protein